MQAREPVLILGARGMLGTQVAGLYPGAAAWDREDIDVLDAALFERRVREVQPGAVINCVAFNDVDGAEDRPERAFELNALFPGRLASLCEQLRIPLVHYSTNYVFDGVAGEYEESAAPNPLSAYGKSKAGGERLVAQSTEQYYVVRTAVLFGPKGRSEVSKRSFVELMVELAAQKDCVQAVADEINSVTYVADLAAATRRLLDTNAPFGTYHLVNEGAASWYDLACRIFEHTPRKPAVAPVPAAAFPRKARRPARAVLRNTKSPALRHWTAALDEFLLRG